MNFRILLLATISIAPLHTLHGESSPEIRETTHKCFESINEYLKKIEAVKKDVNGPLENAHAKFNAERNIQDAEKKIYETLYKCINESNFKWDVLEHSKQAAIHQTTKKIVNRIDNRMYADYYFWLTFKIIGSVAVTGIIGGRMATIISKR